MMERSWTWLVAGGVLMLSVGCSSPYDPDVHPRRLVAVGQLPRADAVDLDGNGRDELVRKGAPQEGHRQSVLIRTVGGRAVAQVNFGGDVHRVHTKELVQDGRLELLVSVRHGDSLFYNVVSAEGEVLQRFLAVTGTPRKVPGGTIDWDIRGHSVHVADVTDDGEREVLSFFRTGFARQPRGVWVHTYPGGRLLGRRRIGALLQRSTYFGDVDDDAEAEWLFGSSAPNNGAKAGGMTDDRAYLGAIEVTERPHVQWSKEMGETFAEVLLQHGDLDRDGQPEFIALRRPRSGRQTASPLHQVDPATGESLRRFVPGTILRDVHVGPIGPRGQDRILVLDESGTIRILDEAFNVLRRRSFKGKVDGARLLSDLEGEGRSEVIVHTERGTLWLDADLSTRAVLERSGRWQVFRMGGGAPPRVLIRGPESGKMTQFRIAENPFWWVHRYGPIAGLLLAVGAALGGGLFGVRRYRRFQLREAVRDRVAAHAEREWLLVHPRTGIQMTSAGAARALGLEHSSSVDWEPLRDERPDVHATIERLVEAPAGPQRAEVRFDGGELMVTGTPLDIIRWGHPYWLIWLEPKAEDVERYRAQGLMAQRVAHDLKNPLTSILLTLQRMQMAYREEDDGLADALDEYTERIEERISSLRRMTTNVLKFMGKEELRRSPTDLSVFLEKLSDELAQNLPPDIELRRQLEDDLPVVAVDQDQMRSVIENLVTNAIEAMPEGGVLTLSTRLARDLYFIDQPRARDYAVVEVFDTGVGMTAAERERLFEPGFSTRDDTGLGMALVRKIMDDHGGQIEIESEPDVGTTVTLYVPTEDEGGPSLERD